MKFNGVTLFLVALFTLVLMMISPEGRNLQSSPQSQISTPPGPIDKLRDQENHRDWGGCWKCW
ncbi:hypothetical protein HanPSC8_Chr11g0492291 [Helianthus annuus]|nr:hypothetical protein HanPSC8_Chr11g0492291 [Helianthus annuus]